MTHPATDQDDTVLLPTLTGKIRLFAKEMALVMRAFFMLFFVFATLEPIKGGPMNESWLKSIDTALVGRIQKKREEKRETERTRQALVDASIAEINAYAEVLHRLTPEANEVVNATILPFWQQLSTDDFVRRFIEAHGTTIPADIRLLAPVGYAFPREAIGEFGHRRNDEGKPFQRQAEANQYFHDIIPGANPTVILPETNWESSLRWRPRMEQQGLIVRTTLAGGPRSMAGAMLAKQTERELLLLDHETLIREIHPSVLIAWANEISSGRIFETIASQVR